MNPTKRGQQLAASAERWAETAESRASITYHEGAGPVLNTHRRGRRRLRGSVTGLDLDRRRMTNVKEARRG